MSTPQSDAMQRMALEGARIAVLGYDAEAREHAHALRLRNTVTIGVVPDTAAWGRARADGFAVDHPWAAVANAQVVVVRDPDAYALWRQSERRVEPGALVVFASAGALQRGTCASSGMDVVLVTKAHDEGIGSRLAVHRDVTRRALLRAVGYARAVFPPETPLRMTTISQEAEMELLASGERTGKLLALTLSSSRIDEDGAPARMGEDELETEPTEIDEALLQLLLNRVGPW